VALLFAMATLAALPGCGWTTVNATVRAQSLVRQDRADEAIALLRKRLEAHPDDVAARRLLVRVLGAAGDIVGARAEVAELARRLPPDDPAPYLELGHALELTHSYDEALEAYDQAAAIAPGSPDGPREGGMRSARWGELEVSRPRLEEAVRRGARDEETWHTLGLVRLHLQDYDGAESAYRAGAAADPRGAECWLGLATVGIVRGDPRLALDAYDQVVARSPRFASAQLGRAWALAQLGRRGEAARALDRAQELGAPPAPIARQRASLSSDAGPSGAASGDAPPAPPPELAPAPDPTAPAAP
jgi:tetratricopeptide (TPR) repeat protein